VAAKRVSLLSATVPDRPGELAALTGAIAKAGVNLLGVVGYSLGRGKAAIVCAPADADAAKAAAKQAGLKVSEASGVLLEGKDAVGAGHRLSKKIADAGINIQMLAALAARGRYQTLIVVAKKDTDKLAATLKAK